VSFEAWLAFCVTETLLCLTPGPAVLFVVSVALARGMRPGLVASLGILAANVLYFALSATGIAAVVLASNELFTLLKWAGAGYLIWMGLRMLFSRSAAAEAPEPRPVHHAFLRGLVVQGANPKALVYFVALLPQFIDPTGPVVPQILLLGVSSVVIELAVLTLYVAFAVRARRLAGSRLAGPLERVGGAFLVAAGARLALVRSQ
jgi:threonine/homoserine/homoserine lactone efflux protein